MDIAEIYETYKNAVYRLALVYLTSQAEAEDAVQDVFLKLLTHGRGIPPEKMRFWLLTVTANLCKDRLRAGKRHPVEELPDAGYAESDLVTEVMALPEGEREVIHLFYYEGYSVKEIARILGISGTAVTTRLSRARKHLRERLEEY
jgi:RNA polymerase sigma-70 factor (ECF subfamily)